MTEQKTYKNPVKAIHAYCVQCCGGSLGEVKRCPTTTCALYPFKDGRNTFRAKTEISEERRAKLAETLVKARENRKVAD